MESFERENKALTQTELVQNGPTRPKKPSFGKGTIIFAILVFLAFLLGANGCSTYNKLVTSEADVNQAWSQVENQYQRRFDLIPNLVETVKGYAKHESETYEKVTQARAGLSSAYNQAQALATDSVPASNQSFQDYSRSQADLQKALSIYVNAVREAYPDLKANEQFLNLQAQLEGTENRIATERGRFIEQVTAYNLMVRRFPGNIWAGLFGFQVRPQFEADREAQTAPKVSF